jgi:hypothetical protein
VWNVLYVMLRTYDPTLLDSIGQGVSMREVSTAGYVVGYDSLFVNTSVFGSLGGLFMTALQETGKQMFVHSVSKNTMGQWALPLLTKLFGGRKSK